MVESMYLQRLLSFWQTVDYLLGRSDDRRTLQGRMISAPVDGPLPKILYKNKN